jgi:hypothetical protein
LLCFVPTGFYNTKTTSNGATNVKNDVRKRQPELKGWLAGTHEESAMIQLV